MKSLVEKIRTEPALLSGLVSAIIALAVGFGLDISADQVSLIMAVVAAVMAIVVRQQVTPTIKVSAERDADNQDIAGEALAKDNPLIEKKDPVNVTPAE